MLFQLIYASSASGLYDGEVYRQIAHKAAARNAQINVSGLMLLFNESIIQVLEGDQETVLPLFGKIKDDPRHKNHIVLSQGPIPQRQFKTWAMGFQEIVDQDEPEFLFQLRNRTLDQKLPENICTKTAALLTSFRKTSGLELNI